MLFNAYCIDLNEIVNSPGLSINACFASFLLWVTEKSRGVLGFHAGRKIIFFRDEDTKINTNFGVFRGPYDTVWNNIIVGCHGATNAPTAAAAERCRAHERPVAFSTDRYVANGASLQPCVARIWRYGRFPVRPKWIINRRSNSRVTRKQGRGRANISGEGG